MSVYYRVDFFFTIGYYSAVMQILAFFLYIISFTNVVITMSLALYFYSKHKKRAIITFTILLAGILLLLIRGIIQLYPRIFSRDILLYNKYYTHITYYLNAIAFFLLVVNSPFFYHSITGIKPTRKKIQIFVFIGIAMLINSIYYLCVRTDISFIILKTPLHLVNLYGVIFFIGNFNNIGNRQIKKYLIIFFVITLVFLPYFLIDGIVLKIVLGFPVYNIIINVLALFFSFNYFNQPNFFESSKCTDYFKKTFSLTFRELEIVDLIIDGLNNTEIGNKLFISPKTVENHIYNIYNKIGIKNRFQLFSLIIANSDISRPHIKSNLN